MDDVARTDAPRASTIVRLHRRVDALLAAPKVVIGGDNGGGAGGVGGVDAGFVVNGGDGEPAPDINDVLGEAEDEMATTQGFLDSRNASLLGLA